MRLVEEGEIARVCKALAETLGHPA